jgi:16S rRNA (guanine1516-N2)-methyltransferase
MTTISVLTNDNHCLATAKTLASNLNLPFSENDKANFDYFLVVSADGLSLQHGAKKFQPFFINFLSEKLTYRRKQTSLRKEMLARAMGLKSNTTPKIVDATAGLGRDSFILASLGFKVTMLERSPLIYVLLADAIKRAKQVPETAAIVGRMQLLQTDAVSWLQQLEITERPEIIYLDPMFAPREKSALVKKEMQIFHDTVGVATDNNLLLTTALACATKRVVVKRPRLATNLAGISPAFSQVGKNNRFDVYLCLG